MGVEGVARGYERRGLSFTRSLIYGFRGINGHVSIHLMHWSPERGRLILGKAYFSEECPFNEAAEAAEHVLNEWRPTRPNGEPEDYNLVIRGNVMYTDFNEVERRLIIHCALRSAVADSYELMYRVIKMSALASLYWAGELLRARNASYFEYLRLKKALKLALNL